MLQTNLDKLQAELQQCKQAIDLTNQMKNIEYDELHHFEMKYKELKEKTDEMERKYKNCITDIELCREPPKSAEDNKEIIRKSDADLQAEMMEEKHKKEIEKIVEQYQEVEGKNTEERKKVDLLTTQVEKQMKKNMDVQNALMEAEIKIELLNSELKTMNEVRGNDAKNIKKVEMVLETKENELKALKSKYEKLGEQLSIKTKEENENKKKFVKKEIDFADELSKHKNKINELENEIKIKLDEAMEVKEAIQTNKEIMQLKEMKLNEKLHSKKAELKEESEKLVKMTELYLKFLAKYKKCKADSDEHSCSA